jgi:hypothetical protein
MFLAVAAVLGVQRKGAQYRYVDWAHQEPRLAPGSYQPRRIDAIGARQESTCGELRDEHASGSFPILRPSSRWRKQRDTVHAH